LTKTVILHRGEQHIRVRTYLGDGGISGGGIGPSTIGGVSTTTTASSSLIIRRAITRVVHHAFAALAACPLERVVQRVPSHLLPRRLRLLLARLLLAGVTLLEGGALLAVLLLVPLVALRLLVRLLLLLPLLVLLRMGV